MRGIIFFAFLIWASSLSAQTIAFPDSAAVVKNKVKIARIYFKSDDGKRHLQKQLHYDTSGRIIVERENERTYYFAYTYDSIGRRVTTTQRSPDGTFIQKFREEYNGKDSTRRTTLYLAEDTLHAAYVYTFDHANRKIREEHNNKYGRTYIYAYRYDRNGDQIYSYDSSGTERIASERVNERLVSRRTYDPQGKLLHYYRYTYTPDGSIVTLTDSSSSIKTVKYVITYNAQGFISAYHRNNTKMSQPEIDNFRKEFFYLFPDDNIEDGPYGFPSMELINEHHFTYDKNGNIVRDELVQRMGNRSQSYVYEYEYEYY